MPARRAQTWIFSAFSAWCGLLAISAIVPGVARASDQDLERARVLDQQGVRAYREERYNDAIRFFEEARRLGGPPSEIWNIAKCHVHMDEPEEAAKIIAEYLDQKGLSPSDRAEAEQQLHEIQHRHSSLTVSSSPSGATVYLEGHRWVGITPATIDVAAGEHKITVESPGYEPEERSITARFGRAIIVDDVRLSRSSRAGASTPQAPTQSAPSAPDATPRGRRVPHRLVLSAELGFAVPRFGSIGGSAAPAGYLTAAYVAIDDPNAVVAVGAKVMLTGDSWSNTENLPNTNSNCTSAVSNSDSATAVSAFVDGEAAWRASPRWRLGGNLGLGFAAYAMSEGGRDVFLPSCRPSPGVEPAVHVEGTASYAFSRELRLLLSPIVLEAQPAFGGTSSSPKDATGLWLRLGAAAGLAFDLF
jgi:hypothetical protein